MKTSKKLTIGIVNENNYDALITTIQSIRLYHSEILSDIEFIVLDKDSDNSKEMEITVKTLMENQIKGIPIRYIYEKQSKYSTGFFDKQQLIKYCETPYFLYCENGAIFSPGALSKLIQIFETNQDTGYGIIQGVELDISLQDYVTHTVFEWDDIEYGRPGKTDFISSEIFAVPGARLNVFACRKSTFDFVNFFQETFVTFRGNTENADNLYCDKTLRNFKLGVAGSGALIWTKSQITQKKTLTFGKNSIANNCISYAITFKRLGMHAEVQQLAEKYSQFIQSEQFQLFESTAQRFVESSNANPNTVHHSNKYLP